jgi:hypothetical protein
MTCPADADRLWLEPSRIEAACNVRENAGYHHAAQTTRAFGKLMLDELDSLGGEDGLVRALTRVVGLPLEAFPRAVPPVEIRRVRKSKTPGDDLARHDVIDREDIGGAHAVRDIVVPGLLRRALSLHVASILTETSDHLLPEEGIAYRPHSRRVVQAAILDVARQVRSGFEYWAKLDIKSFFPSVPWRGLHRALRRFGYSEDFTRRVMALVRTPILAKMSWASWVPVENISGAQAGLPESSVLANIFLSDLDQRVVALGLDMQKQKRSHTRLLDYRRYSDDLLILGRTKEAVRRAVVEIDSWVSKQGMTIKEAP